MLQYLLNITAIWLISLVLFDLFLRKESYHSYNRFYLLFTLLLGISLPLWQWPVEARISTAALDRPLERVMTAKQTIVSAATQSTSLSWEQWITGIYFAGVMIALGLLIVDIVKLTMMYKTGRRSKQDSWTIIETGKEHAPFSFMNTLFVCSIQQYDIDEWHMITAHEKRHSTLLHFADLLLMHIARVIFWFHPLVYSYNKRLLLVHEYQADNASARSPQIYGRFLIEQAVLQAAPSITHSFNRSPIKNRIVMLTKRSSAFSRLKMFTIIPVAVVCIVFFSKNSFSQNFERHGNVVTYRGNNIEYVQDTRKDTIVVVDPISGQEITKIISFDPAPASINGKPIYGTRAHQEDVSGPEPYSKNGSVEDYLLKRLSKNLDKLSDGTYRIRLSNVIVNPKGKIVFYQFDGLLPADHNNTIPPETVKAIGADIDDILNSVPPLKPAKLRNTAVFAVSNVYLEEYKIQVKDHQSTTVKSWK